MKKKGLKGALSELAAGLFETPSEAVPGGWSVTLTDGREAYVTGCRAILSYDETMVTIDAGGVFVFIRGEELDIVRYCERDITVRGRIFSVGTDEAAEFAAGEGGAI